MNIIKLLSLSLLCISSGFLYAASLPVPCAPPPGYNPQYHSWDAPPPPPLENHSPSTNPPGGLAPEAPPPPFESPSAPPPPIASDEDILTGQLARNELQKAHIASLDAQLAELKKQYEEVRTESSGATPNFEVALAQIATIKKGLDDINAKLVAEYDAVKADCLRATENHTALEGRYRALHTNNNWCHSEIKRLNNQIIDLAQRLGRATGDKNNYSDQLKRARQETASFRSMSRVDKKSWADAELTKENRAYAATASKVQADRKNLLDQQQKAKIAESHAETSQQKLAATKESQEKNARDKGIKESVFTKPTAQITDLYTLFSSQVRYAIGSQEYNEHAAKIDAAFAHCANKAAKLELCQRLYNHCAHNESNPQAALAVDAYAKSMQKTHYWWLGGSGVVGLAAFFTAAFGFRS